MLNRYLQEVMGFVRDRGQRTMNPADLVMYINRARREIAMRTQCIRKIPPISGSVATIQVTNPGSGYSANPVVTISAPDLPGGQKLYPAGAQATATAMVIAGQIAGISVNFGGSGYFQPTATITDATGTGATAVVQTSPINVFVANQEEYFLSDIPMQVYPGVKSAFAILSNYVIFSNIRYRISHYSLTDYKSYIENYPFQYYFVPVACAQKEQGAGGSYLFYPIPSQQYAWEPDCLCLPDDLTSDGSPEAIPEPWTDAVAYQAAAYAFQEMQNFNTARYYQDQFKDFVNRYGVYARPRMLISTYGRR
jgi:hypothetical protein